jgi:uncharacterized membrane protein required for colicin V production
LSNFSIPSELNILDLLLILTLLISGVSGYRLGLLQSLFKAAGYIVGGLLGIYLALNYLEQFGSKSIKLALTLILILLSAISLEYILAKVGVLIHKGLLFASVKLLDSLLGALLALTKNLIIFYLIATVLLFSTFKHPVNYIKDSYIYSYLDKHLPKIFTDLKGEVDKLI